jgi:hypothetical protein
MHYFHSVYYFPLNSLYQIYVIHGKFYDRIEAWLEESYSTNVPMNYRCHIFSMGNRVFDVLIFPTFTLCLFQALSLIFFLEHMFVGLGLYRWIHWNHDFT